MVYVIQVCWQLASRIKNKFEKLLHLVGFIIRIYHVARSPERQNLLYSYIWYVSPTCFGVCAPSWGRKTVPVPWKKLLLWYCHLKVQFCILYIMSNVPFITHHIKATELKPQITMSVGLQGTSIVVLPHDGPQELKHVGDTHQMYVYNRYRAFSWY